MISVVMKFAAQRMHSYDGREVRTAAPFACEEPFRSADGAVAPLSSLTAVAACPSSPASSGRSCSFLTFCTHQPQVVISIAAANANSSHPLHVDCFGTFNASFEEKTCATKHAAASSWHQ